MTLIRNDVEATVINKAVSDIDHQMKPVWPRGQKNIKYTFHNKSNKQLPAMEKYPQNNSSHRFQYLFTIPGLPKLHWKTVKINTSGLRKNYVK